MIKFTKMQGLGNDYVYIDCFTKEQEIKEPSYLSKIISNRNFGIGSDGLILICKSNVADFKMRMFNYDGSEAEMCGNGIRCVGKFVYDKGLTKKETIKVETLSGIKTLKLNIKNNEVDTIKVDMGEPILEPQKIPVNFDKQPVKDLEIKVLDRKYKFTCVSMGNPHAITFIDKIDEIDIRKYGILIENNKYFPKKTNVEFCEIKDRNNIKMRVWERGTGETLACGTGACAALVAAVLNEYTNRTVIVELLGGKLQIQWDEKDNHIYMTGSAQIVFEGYIEEEKLNTNKFC